MKALNGFIFYNSGPISGASQVHKHTQIIPFSSLTNKRIPINQRVLEEIKRSQFSENKQNQIDQDDLEVSMNERLFILSEYQSFKHTFCRLDPNLFQQMNSE